MVDAVPQNILIPIPPELVQLGKLAFDAYAAQVGGLTYDGKPIPTWDQVTDKVRGGWCAGAHAVAKSILLPVEAPSPIRPRSAAGFARSSAVDAALQPRRPAHVQTVEADGPPEPVTAPEATPAKAKTRRVKLFIGAAYRGKVEVPVDVDTLEHDGLTFTRSKDQADRFLAAAPEAPVDPEALPPAEPTEPTDAPPPAAPEPGPPATRHG